MSTHEQETFLQTYDWVKSWRDLPWSHEEPTLFLPEICRQRKTGKALDIGCGSGTDSVFLASLGWEVTALDFMEKALEYTQQRAGEAGVSVTPVVADITTWDPPEQYDLVLDHGLLHNMDPVRYPAYRERIMHAVAEDGDFVLLHWHPLFEGQAQGENGPTRTPREDIKAFFAPEFQERYFAREEFEDLPDFVGRGMTQAYYLFRRNPAESHPAEMIEQVRATLQRHDVDVEAMLEKVSDADVSGELMATIVGPGRLGISHRIPATADAAAELAGWAQRTGQDANEVSKLLRVFASTNLGNVCIRNAKCTECDVSFCKRLRYR
ncbi:MAG: class I SAM-dependent methyltransferase [Gammaproteobacteria bacterium]|nr:class I SAM-dependent methyltransferase [Gammaproteobacteria bacterium]